MKALQLTTLALAMALAGGYANATTYTAPSTLGAGQTYTFENGLIESGSKTFADTFSFTLGSGVTGVNFLFNIALPSSGIESVTFHLPATSSFTMIGGNIYNSYSYFDGEETISFTALDKVEYKLQLTGVNTGANSFSVSGTFETTFPIAQNYSLTVSAVPEPESYALFLAGLGLMAGIARRKSKSN